MKSFHWTLPILCTFIVALQSGAEAKPSAAAVAAEARMVIETAKAGIETADKALSLYDRVIDKVVPWRAFNETLVELDAFRKDYSTESAALIGDIKTCMMNGIDAYFAASQNVFEWAGLVIPLLKAYLRLFEAYNAEKGAAQKTLLMKVLDDGIAKMNAAQADLGRSSSNFNEAAGKLTALHSRFEVEFDEKSEFVQKKITQLRIQGYLGAAVLGPFGIAIAAGVLEGKLVPELKKKMGQLKEFYVSLKGKVQKAFADIDETKKTLKTEIQHIGELKVQTEETKTFLDMDAIEELRDTVTGSVKALITKCEEYRKRHVNKTDLV